MRSVICAPIRHILFVLKNRGRVKLGNFDFVGTFRTKLCGKDTLWSVGSPAKRLDGDGKSWTAWLWTFQPDKLLLVEWKEAKCALCS